MNNFLEEILKSFYDNLIADDAYLIVLKGLWITILISVSGLFFGTALGGFLSFLRISKNYEHFFENNRNSIII